MNVCPCLAVIRTMIPIRQHQVPPVAGMVAARPAITGADSPGDRLVDGGNAFDDLAKRYWIAASRNLHHVGPRSSRDEAIDSMCCPQPRRLGHRFDRTLRSAAA